MTPQGEEGAIGAVGGSEGREPGRALVAGASLALLVGVASIDYLTGVEIRTFPLYFVPLMVVTMRVGRGAGVLFAVLSAVGWLVSNRLAGMKEVTPGSTIINTGVMLLTFGVVVLLTAAQRKGLEHERSLSRTDGLTGVANPRGFYEAASKELERAARYRHPLTIAYLDLDDFKAVNDRFGHAQGDELLRTVASVLRRGTRSGDLVGRLGGDEFVILFPETDREAAEVALSKLKALLQGVGASHRGPIGASIGAVSSTTPSGDVHALLRQADRVMYEAKAAGKNTVRCVEAAMPTSAVDE